MRLLQYKALNLRRVRAAFDKVKAAIQADDFRSADVRKLNAGPYYGLFNRNLVAHAWRTQIAELPAWLWSDKRRKRSCVNEVLARVEVHSGYQPARRLWVRTRNGHYFPNPGMQRRFGEAWQPVHEVLALGWVGAGCGEDDSHDPQPLESSAQARRAVSAEVEGREALRSGVPA